MKKSLACFGAIALLLCSPGARADDAKAAAERFREGRRAFEAHDYQRAAAEFEAANRAKPAAAALLSAGLAWELGGDLVNAAIDLEGALANGGLEPRDEATARKHLGDLDAKLGHLEIRGPAGAQVSVDGHDKGSLPVDVRVIAGDHAIEAHTPGGAVVHRIASVQAGATAKVDVTPTIEAPLPPPPPSPTQRTAGWIGVGVGGAAFVAGAIAGGVGLATRDQFVGGGDTSGSLHDQAIALRTIANVLWIGAGVIGITGFVLVLTAPRVRHVSVGVGPASAGLKVAF